MNYFILIHFNIDLILTSEPLTQYRSGTVNSNTLNPKTPINWSLAIFNEIVPVNIILKCIINLKIVLKWKKWLIQSIIGFV